MRLLMLVVLLIQGSALAQGLFSEGRDFYLGYIPPSHPNVLSGLALAEVKVYALVSSYTDNEIFVSYFDPGTGKEGAPVKYSVKAFRTVEVLLDQIKARPTEPGDIAEYRSIHITTNDPVTIHYYSSGPCAGGGYLALPTLMWGREYVVATEQDNPGAGAWVSPPAIADADKSNGCFMIIAAEANTRVTIIPNARTGGGHPGATQGQGATGKPQPYEVTLHHGQTYFVRSTSAYQGDYDDMSGSIVKADKPIAVIMAHENANVGDGIVKETNPSDARDFMIEQAIPWEFASNVGYMSSPMEDGPGVLAGGQGEDVKVFVAETNAAATVSTSTCSGPSSPLNTAPFSIPPAAKTNLAAPLYYAADSGKKFQLIQYELRSDGDGAPYTAPAMTNVVPFHCARNAYLWYIPKKIGANGEVPYQDYYVTIISRYPVSIVADGSAPRVVGEVLKPTGRKWVCFNGLAPASFGGGNLSATTYKFSPGVTYYARSSHVFMVYVFGYVASRDQQNNINISGFAFPGGLRAGNIGKASIKTNATQTSCTSWELCIQDTGGVGIKSVSLINDPHNLYYYYEETHPYHQPESYNYVLSDGKTQNTTSIEYITPISNVCVALSIIDTTKDALALVEIIDGLGGRTFLPLRIDKQQLRITRRVEGPTVGIGEAQTNTYIFKTPFYFDIEDISISEPLFSYQVQSRNSNPLTYWDSLWLEVTYSPIDTMTRSAHLSIRNACNSFDMMITVSGMTGLIFAGDLNFGTATDTECRDILIENRGKDTFQLLRGEITGIPAFSFGDSTANKPQLLPPGTSTKRRICYTPGSSISDTGSITWITDIPAPYDRSIKSTSSLIGRPLNAGISSADQRVLSVYPNPARNQLSIDLSSFTGDGVLSLTNSIGVTSFSKVVTAGQIEEVELGDLPAGQYTVIVKLSEVTYRASILIR